MTTRHAFAAGTVVVGLGVALGAFGAHGLRDHVSQDLLGTFETGVRYQVYHGLAIMAAALAGDRWPVAWRPATWAFLAGTVVFSGSLYVLVLTGARAWGAVTPFGGALFLIGWGMLTWSVLRSSSAD